MGHRKPRKGRASEQSITRRGLDVYQKGDQIKALGGNRWDVASRGTEGVWYRVSLAGESPTCECAYHTTGNGCRCKHIAAAWHALLVSSEAALDRKVDVGEQDLSCPDCVGKRSTPVTDDGTAASTRRGRGTGALYAGGGSGTTRALSTAGCRARTSSRRP